MNGVFVVPNLVPNVRVLELIEQLEIKQESPAVADKPARRLRKVCTVYVRAVAVSCIASLPIDSVPMVSYYVL